MSLRYDVFAIDLDGTLLRRDGTVSARNIAAVRAAREAGLEVLIATGRALIESAHVMEAIEHDGRFVGAGGALLCDIAARSTIDRRAMPAHLVRHVTESLNRHGHLAHVLKDADAAGYDYLIVGQGQLDPATRWWFDHLPVRARFIESLEEDEHPDETVRCGTVAVANELHRVVDELREDLGEQIFVQHWPAVAESHALGQPTHLLEVFNPDVDKWTMIERYTKTRRITTDRIAAIGDGLNDVRMVREAGLGIAVANADPSVLHAAEQVTQHHEEDGVAVAIERILSGVW